MVVSYQCCVVGSCRSELKRVDVEEEKSNAIGNARYHREETKGSEFILIFTNKYRRIRSHLIGQRSYHNRNVKREIANHKYLRNVYKTSQYSSLKI